MARWDSEDTTQKARLWLACYSHVFAVTREYIPGKFRLFGADTPGRWTNPPQEQMYKMADELYVKALEKENAGR